MSFFRSSFINFVSFGLRSYEASLVCIYIEMIGCERNINMNELNEN